MGVLADWQIRHLCETTNPMISPFCEETKGPDIISYGLSSYGYDIRVGKHFKVCDSHLAMYGKMMDPKNPDPTLFTEWNVEEFCVIPPNSFALAETVERFSIPRELLVTCIGKSTYARNGIIVNVTPLEPEWKGVLTLEISNTTPLPARIYANEGIGQLVFHVGDGVCERSYADKGGKYQNQKGLTLARMPEKE